MKYKLHKSLLTLLTATLCLWAVAQEPVVTVHLCDETKPFLFGCDTFNHSGTFPGIDVGGTSMTLQLTYGKSAHVSYNDTVILGKTYLFGCETIALTSVGDTTLVDSLTTVAGCDSIVTLNLYVEDTCQTVIMSYNDTVILGEMYLFGCQVIAPTSVGDTTLVDSLTTVAGCDSIVTLNLHIKDSCHTARISYCDTITIGETYLFGCEAITPTVAGDTTLVDSLVTIAGCDSVVTLKLRVLSLEPRDTTIYDTICYATDFVHRLDTLINLTKDTTFTDTVSKAVQLSSRYYLDSLYIYKVKVNPAYYGITDGDTICQGTEHLWADTTWAANSAAGTYVVTRTLTTITDCDSVVTYTLKINPAYYGITDGDTICQGTEHSWADTTWAANSAAGTYVVTRTLTTITDCDSVVTYTLKINPAYYGITDGDTICQGTEHSWADTTWAANSAAGTYVVTRTLTTITDCDSVVTYTLTIHDSIKTITEDTVLCEGDEINWHGQTVDGSKSQYTDILSTQDGICDSILYVLNVDVHSLYLDSLPAYAKDENWLLMIDRRAIRDTFGLNPTEEQVAWYRIQGELDQLPDGETDDVLVGRGYYYTADKALTDDYYAVVEVDLSSIDKCLQVARTVVLRCKKANAVPRLVPTFVGIDQPMTLSDLDDQSATTITIYNAAGSKVRQLSSQGADTYTLSAENISGIYMMLIKNETQTCTIKFTVINQ